MNERGLVTEITQHLGTIFRHMLPGVLVMGTSNLAYPHWFRWVDLNSWEHILVLAVLTIVIGNVWFALNRFVVFQLTDYVLYYWGFESPARRKGEKTNYLVVLGQYVSESLRMPEPETSRRAIDHIQFRASAVLLIATVGELAFLFGLCHSIDSVFEGWKKTLVIGGGIVFGLSVWQSIITRRIDSFVVKSGKELTNTLP